MTLETHLALGRISNLPTVWTNVLAAGALAGAVMPSGGWLPLLIGMSLFYIGGMYYNDACDADYDAQHQAYRPIPSGAIKRQTVELFALGYAVLGIVLVYFAKSLAPLAKDNSSLGWLVSALALIGCIVAYDRHHKQNPFSPLIMASCRLAVFTTSSYALAAFLPPLLFVAMLGILSWLVGLTFLAKHEAHMNSSESTAFDHWPLALLGIPALIGIVLGFSQPWVIVPAVLVAIVAFATNRRLKFGQPSNKGSAIALMIAGICLVDGIFLTYVWGLAGFLFAVIAFAATLFLQRWVSGT